MKVRDLLSINKEFKRFKVLAGEKGLDREIFDIDVLEVPDGVYWARENEFSITTGYFFRNSPKDIVRLIEVQNKNKAAGMGIKLGRFIDELPDEVIQKANECNFPLISFPVDMGYGDLIWPVISYILGETRYEEYIISNFRRELNNTTSKKYYLNNLILMLNNYLDSDIYVLEKEKLKLIASLPNDRDYNTIKELIQQNSYLDNKRKLEVKVNEKIIRIYKIFHHGITFGYFGIMSEDFDSEKSNLEMLILKEIYTHVVIHILSYSKNQLEYTKSIEEFFIKLVNNKYKDKKMNLKEDAKLLGLNYYDKRVVISLKSKHLGDSTNKKELSKYINRIFDNTLKNLYVVDNINNIILIFTVNEFSKKNLVELSKNIICKIKIKYPELDIKLGISKECGSLRYIPDAYSESVYSYNIGEIKSKNKIYFYDDFIAYHMMSNISDNTVVKKIYRNIINKIKRESEENSDELIKTLSFLCRNDFNMKKTAEELFIHRNTLYKRVEKIKKITGYDINDSETKLIFKMIIKLDEIVN